MADIKSVPEDGSRNPLLDSGSELGTDLITLTTNWQDLIFPIDVKQVSVYVVSGILVLRGTVPIHRSYLDAAAVVDNLDGTVTIAAALHGLTIGDDATFYNTDYFDGTWELEAGGDANNLIITPDPQVLDLEGITVVDATGGRISIAYPNQPFNDGDTVTMVNSDNYDTSYTLHVNSTANSIVLTAAYAAETFAAGVTLSGFPTETLAVTDYAIGFVDPTYSAGAEPRLPLAVVAETVVAQIKASGACVISVAVVR